MPDSSPGLTSPDTAPLRQSVNWQLVQLYQQTHGQWDDAQRATFQALQPVAPQTPPENTFALEDWRTAIRALDWDAARPALGAHLANTPDEAYGRLALGVLSAPEVAAFEAWQQVAAQPGDYQNLAAQLSGTLSQEGADWRQMALYLLAAEEWHLADYALSQAITAEPLDAFSHAYRGFARDQQGRDGLPDIERAITLDPGLAVGYFMLGLHERQRGAFDTSQQAFLDAYLIEQDNPAYAAEVAQAHVLNESLLLAEEWFLTAVRLSERDARFVNLAAAFYIDEQYRLAEGGLDFVRQAAQDFPGHAGIQASWGRLLFFAGDTEGAEAALLRALEIAPQQARARFFWAELLDQQGDVFGALEAYTALARGESAYQDRAQRAIQRLAG